MLQPMAQGMTVGLLSRHSVTVSVTLSHRAKPDSAGCLRAVAAALAATMTVRDGGWHYQWHWQLVRRIIPLALACFGRY